MLVQLGDDVGSAVGDVGLSVCDDDGSAAGDDVGSAVGDVVLAR